MSFHVYLDPANRPSAAPPAFPRIIQNAVYIIPTDEFIQSRHVHDFVRADLGEGRWIAVDGGLQYIRRAGDLDQEGILWEDWSLQDTDSFGKIAERLLWDGRPLSCRSPEELQVILTYTVPLLHRQVVYYLLSLHANPYRPS